MPKNDVRQALLSQAVPLQRTVFLMGCALSMVSPQVRARAERRHSSLGSLLAPSPPHWVHMPAFRVARRLVTNGEYRRFLQATTTGEGRMGRIYDDQEMWRYVWKRMGYDLGMQRIWLVRSSGAPTSMDERYDHLDSFLDAYLESLRLETIRVMVGPAATLEPVVSPGREVIRIHSDEGASFASIRYDPVIDTVFNGLARKILGRGIQWQAAVFDNQPVELETGDLDRLIGLLSSRVRDASAAQPYLFGSGDTRPEPLVFLERCRESLRARGDCIPIHHFLYPRLWPSLYGEEDPLFPGPDVPWTHRPVYGISFYEALAFSLWLSESAEPGEFVTLQTEAEYERAASWPDDAGMPEDGGQCVLDSALKNIYPWQSHSNADAHDLFGGESKQLQNYFSSRADFERLLAASGRPTSGGDRLDMLVGFGWQWTTDRFDEKERHYSRFTDGTCSKAFEGNLKQAIGLATDAWVYDFASNRSRMHSSFVLRGAPAVIGGQGLTTRRFAANPLRGYPNVGFRWIVRHP